MERFVFVARWGGTTGPCALLDFDLLLFAIDARPNGSMESMRQLVHVRLTAKLAAARAPLPRALPGVGV